MSDSYLYPTTVKASFVLGDTSSVNCSKKVQVKQHFDSTFL